MVKSYTEHYEVAKSKYVSQSKYQLSDINVTVVRPNLDNQALQLPENYAALINKIHDQVKPKFKDEKCLFFPPNVKKEEDVVRMIKDAENFKVDGLNELCDFMIPQIEEKYFHSYIHAEKVYFYRNIVTDNAPRTSWLWHYDNHPVEVHKMIVYLSEVTEDSGPFEYLKSPDGKAIVVTPSRTGVDNWGAPKWPQSRVPADVIAKYVDRGYVPTKVTGPKGTILLFDDNVIHKANLGKSGHRDVLSIQLRPATSKMRPYIHPDRTGGFEANDVVKDPEQIRPFSKWKK